MATIEYLPVVIDFRPVRRAHRIQVICRYKPEHAGIEAVCQIDCARVYALELCAELIGNVLLAVNRQFFRAARRLLNGGLGNRLVRNI